MGPNGEPELTLEGRYDDEDHKMLAIYGVLLVGEKCKPSEKINLVSDLAEDTAPHYIRAVDILNFL